MRVSIAQEGNNKVMGWYLRIIFEVIKERKPIDDMTVVRTIANKLVGRSQERKEAV